MPIVKRKDKKWLQGTPQRIKATGDPHYLMAYLWKTREAFQQNTGIGPYSCACHVPTEQRLEFRKQRGKPAIEIYHPPPLLGELHFIVGKWDTEIVHHEMTHALLHRLRAFGVHLESLDMDDEEPHCYVAGRWADQVYRWLWATDGGIRQRGKK